MAIGIVTDSDFEKELSRHVRTEKVVPSVSVPKEKTVPSPKSTRPASQETKRKDTHSDSVPSIQPLTTKGRNKGDVNIPESLRKILGETAAIDGRKQAVSLANEFGVSSSSVSAYANGATSTKTYNTPAQEIFHHINESKQRAIKKASGTLEGALGAITQDKLDYADAKDLAGIAKDMSVVIKNLEPPPPPAEVQQIDKPQFIIFAPTFKDERTYESIVVSE